MKRAALSSLAAALLTGGAAFAASPQPARPAGGATAVQPAPLSMENAVPMVVPAAPRLRAPPPPPAPEPIVRPELMTAPEAPLLTTPAPIAVPADPQGAPAVVRRSPEQPADQYAAPSLPVEERVAGGPAKPPPPPMSPAPAAPAAVAPPPVPVRAGVLDFAAGSAVLPPEAESLLTALAADMRAVPTRRLQLRAYAAGDVDTERQARQLSLARALAVRERLTALGVRSTRIDVRPLGVAAPVVDPGRRDRVDVEYASE